MVMQGRGTTRDESFRNCPKRLLSEFWESRNYGRGEDCWVSWKNLQNCLPPEQRYHVLSSARATIVDDGIAITKPSQQLAETNTEDQLTPEEP